MTKQPSLTDITSLTNSSAITALSQNWDAIQEAFSNTLSLDGSTPNAMNADLDLNGNALLNVGTIDVENLTLDGQTITDIASVPEWRGAWLTATAYAKNDLVKTAGNVYICLVAHTSGTFATDLTALDWELMVSKGDSGAGTGDMLAANNLSDLANAATARSNLSLGTVATENTVPISKGGTGVTDAASALTALGGQPLEATLTSLGGLSLVSGDLLYATAADTLARLPKGTDGEVLGLTAGVPDWVASSAPVLLASKTASASATLDFTEFNNATYSRYKFVLKNVKPTTDNVILNVRFSTDAGVSYDSGGTNYTSLSMGRNTGGNVDAGTGGDSAISITSPTAGTSNSVGNGGLEFGVSGEVLVMSAGNASARTTLMATLVYDPPADDQFLITSSGKRNATQDTDALRFLFSSGTIASGTIEMWGLV